jgi:hypothetical protein
MEVMERPGLGKQRYAQLSSPIQYHDECRRSKLEARMTIVLRQRRYLSTRRSAEASIFEYEGQKYRAALGRYPDGAPAEIFLDVVGKAGSAIQEHVRRSPAHALDPAQRVVRDRTERRCLRRMKAARWLRSTTRRDRRRGHFVKPEKEECIL